MKYIPQLLLASALVSNCLAAPPPPPPAASAVSSAPRPGPPAADAGDELKEGKRLLRHGQAAEALIRLKAALGLYQQAKDRRGEAAAHDLLGELYERQGQYEEALRHFRAALEIFSGKPAAPRDAPSGGSKPAVNFDRYHADLMHSKIGNMLYRQDLDDEARYAFQEMPANKPDTSMKRKGQSLGEALSGIAANKATDNSSAGAAASAAGSMRAVKDRLDLYRRTIIYATREIGLGRLDVRRKDFGMARTRFQNALDATTPDAKKGDLPFLNLGQSRRFRAIARAGLAEVALREENYDDAVKRFGEAEKDAAKEKRADLMWPAQHGLARALWLQAAQGSDAKKDEKKADTLKLKSLAAYGRALDSIETMRAGSLRADEARTTFLATTRDVFDDATEAFAEMALAGVQPGAPLAGKALEYGEKAFHVSERGRARSLLDLLGESGTQIKKDIPEKLLRQRQENLDTQNEIASLLTGVSPTNEPPKESVEDLEKKLESLQTKFDDIENQIRTENPGYKELTRPQPLTLDQVRSQLLDDGTALLVYSLGSEHSYLWAVTSADVKLYRLRPREEIHGLVSELREQILPRSLRRPVIALTDEEAYRGIRVAPKSSSDDATPFARAAHKLYKAVVEPAAAFVGARRLLVVTEGSLSYVPFEALVTAEGGSDYAALPYLIKTNEVVYAPSASVAAALRRKAAGGSTASGSVLVVADPVYDAGDPRVMKSAAAAPPAAPDPGLVSAAYDVTEKKLGGGTKLARLVATRDEAAQIERLAAAAGLKAVKWLDLEANEAKASKHDLAQYRVLHFATHGFLDTERPQFTGLVLSLVGNDGEDGFLRTGEIFNLRLGAQLVMLSACESGLGRERRGEGVIGLTRAFMYAGAPSVGVTLWSVADAPTAELMGDFYERFPAKEGASSALRSARLKMIEGKDYAAPFYWAPFVLVGDWR